MNEHPESQPSALHKIEHLIDIEQWSLAEREVQALMAAGHSSATLHVLMARCRLGREEWKGAVEEAETALAADPEEADAHCVLAAAVMQLGENRRAEEHLLEALRIDSTDSRAFLLYGHLMFVAGHLEKAEKLVRRALNLNAESSGAHGLLARILAEKNRRAASLDHGRRSVGLAADDDRSHLNLGISYLQAGHPFLARRHLREAVRLDPSDEGTVSAYLAADRACRWLYLPMYYSSLLTQRLPGRQFAIWGGMLLLCLVVLPALGVDRLASILLYSYVGFCLYTWIAEPLTSLWIRIRPTR